MKRTALSMALLLSAMTVPGARAADLKDLQGPVLQEAFNKDKDYVRLLFLGSPT